MTNSPLCPYCNEALLFDESGYYCGNPRCSHRCFEPEHPKNERLTEFIED